jgi:hypothetical protein
MAGGIKSIAVKGSVTNARILAGYNAFGNATNPDASIGAITIGGNLIATSIVAGVEDGADNLFGTSDDKRIADNGDLILAKIASITVKGFAAGSTALGDSFGILADQIGKLSIGGVLYTLKAGPNNDTFFESDIRLGVTNDFRVIEPTIV